MTETLTAGIEIYRGSCSRKVLDVLERIVTGDLDSTEEITGVYDAVERLLERTERLEEKFSEISLCASPFLMHLKKMAGFESEVNAV